MWLNLKPSSGIFFEYMLASWLFVLIMIIIIIQLTAKASNISCESSCTSSTTHSLNLLFAQGVGWEGENPESKTCHKNHRFLSPGDAFGDLGTLLFLQGESFKVTYLDLGFTEITLVSKARNCVFSTWHEDSAPVYNIPKTQRSITFHHDVCQIWGFFHNIPVSLTCGQGFLHTVAVWNPAPVEFGSLSRYWHGFRHLCLVVIWDFVPSTVLLLNLRGGGCWFTFFSLTKTVLRLSIRHWHCFLANS